MKLNKLSIGIVGLGYVGLPIALEFGKKINTIGLDRNLDRVSSLIKLKDTNKEVDFKKIKNSKKLKFTSDIKDLKNCNIFIVTVPTPLKKKTKPDLSLIIAATESIAKILKPNDLVIYESTVYPGTTEEICVPILKKISKLNYINSDKKIKNGFYCGYSPERINPGDKKSYLTNIPKIVSGSNKEITKFIKKLYELIIKKKIHVASEIKIAEGAKIIENTQRDLNIALANEFLMIFDKLNIDYNQVFRAASTKWNFLKFTPGLVGGHCIGVDPYYLTYKAKKSGFNPKLILAGRKINDKMSFYYAKRCLKELRNRKIKTSRPNILILGATFKENISDCRNSKVFDLIDYFKKHNCKIDVFDPHILVNEVDRIYKKIFINEPYKDKYDCVILCVSHNNYKKKSFQKKINTFCKKNYVLFDMKYFLDEKYYKDKYFTI